MASMNLNALPGADNFPASVQQIADKLLKLIHHYKLDDNRELVRAIQNLQKRVLVPPFKIAILSESAAAKSKLLDALLNRTEQDGMMPPIKAPCIYFTYGQEAEVAVTMADNVTVRLPLANLELFLAQNESQNGVKKVLLRLRNRALSEGLVLIDTPPISAFPQTVSSATLAALQDADACVLRLDASHDLLRSVKTLLDNRRKDLHKFFIIVERASASAMAHEGDPQSPLMRSLAQEYEIPQNRILLSSTIAGEQSALESKKDPARTFQSDLMHFARVHAQVSISEELSTLVDDTVKYASVTMRVRSSMIQRTRLKLAIRSADGLQSQVQQILATSSGALAAIQDQSRRTSQSARIDETPMAPTPHSRVVVFPTPDETRPTEARPTEARPTEETLSQTRFESAPVETIPSLIATAEQAQQKVDESLLPNQPAIGPVENLTEDEVDATSESHAPISIETVRMDGQAELSGPQANETRKVSADEELPARRQSPSSWAPSFTHTSTTVQASSLFKGQSFTGWRKPLPNVEPLRIRETEDESKVQNNAEQIVSPVAAETVKLNEMALPSGRLLPELPSETLAAFSPADPGPSQFPFRGHATRGLGATSGSLLPDSRFDFARQSRDEAGSAPWRIAGVIAIAACALAGAVVVKQRSVSTSIPTAQHSDPLQASSSEIPSKDPGANGASSLNSGATANSATVGTPQTKYEGQSRPDSTPSSMDLSDLNAHGTEAPGADASLQRAISHWASAFKNGDLKAQVTGYAPFVDDYNNLQNVKHDQILADKERAWNNTASYQRYDVTPVSITEQPNGQKTVMVRKDWALITTRGSTISGSDLEKLVFVKIDDDWKIVGEHQMKVLKLHRG